MVHERVMRYQEVILIEEHDVGELFKEDTTDNVEKKP